MEPSIWSLVPPALTILIALTTRQVYFSLVCGILLGLAMCLHWDPSASVQTFFNLLGEKVGGNFDILLFLVLAGCLIALFIRSGASIAYGEWAGKRIHSSKGASILSVVLGLALFIDDYTSCLITGAAMRPAIDRFKVPRAKFAYIIDATAGPVAVISPVATWTVAVMASLPDNMAVTPYHQFINTIPFNYYPLGCIAFLIFIVWLDRDFFSMRAYAAAQAGRAAREADAAAGVPAKQAKGGVLDLVLPIVTLVVASIISMLITGGYLDGKSLTEALGACDSSKCLTYGGFIAIVVAGAMYMPRRILTLGEFSESIEDGLKSMAPAIIILSLAWTLSLVCGDRFLNIGAYVGSVLSGYHSLQAILPACFFLASLLLAFATGTSWGTFAILLPIATTVATSLGGAPDWTFVTLCHSAVLSGAVAGDHISPISDTTILSSTGAGCNHIDHVNTQIPYAMFALASALCGFLAGGFCMNGWIGLAATAASLAVGCLWLATRPKSAYEIPQPAAE